MFKFLRPSALSKASTMMRKPKSILATNPSFSLRTLMGSVALVFAATALLAGSAQAKIVPVNDPKYPGIGRIALPKEIAAWDIDVRPDFKGLPVGAGSVDQGQMIYESKCASCHGIFGESNEVFSPLIGGTTAEDIETGHTANLKNTSFPGRTTMMKVATLSTLWDYINRAMPWNAPKSLSTNEVYAVLAYMLNLAEIIPADFTLSNTNIAQVQAKMPNRNGMTTAHDLWPGDEFQGTDKPDTTNVACMTKCATDPKVSSFLPAHARNNHGNLSEQGRIIGAQLGVDTTLPEGKGLQRLVLQSNEGTPPTSKTSNTKVVMGLLQQNNCLACHGVASKIVGPSFADIAKKHTGQSDYLATKIVSGSSGAWGPVPMPPQSLKAEDVKQIADWLAAGAPQ